ncbi:MAG TPA: hypothetical protein VEI25_17620, partial [Paraburkholderia sp.]|nr:hypothetical protein [Paraburkholderia sp.]
MLETWAPASGSALRSAGGAAQALDKASAAYPVAQPLSALLNSVRCIGLSPKVFHQAINPGSGFPSKPRTWVDEIIRMTNLSASWLKQRYRPMCGTDSKCGVSYRERQPDVSACMH